LFLICKKRVRSSTPFSRMLEIKKKCLGFFKSLVRYETRSPAGDLVSLWYLWGQKEVGPPRGGSTSVSVICELYRMIFIKKEEDNLTKDVGRLLR